MRGEYILESQKLQQLETKYKELSSVVTKDIVDNYV